MNAPTGQPGDLLYHYTDHHGLVGIIENRELWATNLGCLDDLSEFKHGLDFVRSMRDQMIEELISDRPLNDSEKDTAKQILKLIIRKAEESYLRHDPAEYLFTFSLFDSRRYDASRPMEGDPGDNLQQWRAYRKGGLGYCIGFDRDLLESKVTEEAAALQTTFCGKCIYDQAGKLEMLRDIAQRLKPARDLAVDLARRGNSGSTAETASNLASSDPQAAADTSAAKLDISEAEAEIITESPIHYFAWMLMKAVLMKQTDFEPEREWRIVRLAFSHSRAIRFRATNRGITPYVAIPIGTTEDPPRVVPGLIKRVVVGPLGQASEDARQRAASIVKMLLDKNMIQVAGYDSEEAEGVAVVNSRLPC